MRSDPRSPRLLPEPRSARWEGRWVDDVARPTGVAIGAGGPDHPQGYRVHIDEGGVAMAARGAAGARHAEATLRQLRRASPPGKLPAGEVEDWPDFDVRGVMLDVSRDKVPTLATLTALVDRLAELKVNHLQLYMEHTFAYAGHEEVWAEASPLTAGDLDALGRHCAALGVELAPNQNCLGHMERWLRHDRYRPLALSPHGAEVFGRRIPPTTLDPRNPASLALVRDLLGQLLPHFTSRRVHVGLDEPWELEAARGVADYVAHLEAIRRAPELDGREMLVWGDIVALHPECLGELPAGVTVCEWGYEAGHPWAKRLRLLAEAGLPAWVCPGTSSWNSLAGRGRNAAANLAEAAAEGRTAGAHGYLITDWGDSGHLQPLVVSEPWFALGAAVAWCHDTNRQLADDDGGALAAAVDLHMLDDEAGVLGRVLLELAEAHTRIGPQLPNRSILAAPLYSPKLRMGEGATEGMTVEQWDEAAAVVAAAAGRLGGVRTRRADAGQLVDEVAQAAAVLALCAADGRARLAAGGSLAAVAEAERQKLAAAVAPLVDRHRELWLARNRPGGVDDSAAVLQRWHQALLDVTT